MLKRSKVKVIRGQGHTGKCPSLYYNLRSVCLFVCLFGYLLLLGPSSDCHQTWHECRDGPWKCQQGVKKVKGQGHKGSRSNFCISETLGSISIQVGRYLRLNATTHPEGSKRSKVKITRGQGQISASQRPLRRYWSKFPRAIRVNGLVFTNKRSSIGPLIVILISHLSGKPHTFCVTF